MSEDLIRRARAVMARNDKGAYTVPTHGLYPFQWNWDSALSALGFSHFDEPRAWRELETLMAHQWEDGMLPHIIFHERDEGYFPGPEVWDTGRPTPTSGITQPAVAGFAVRRIYERARDRRAARTAACALLPRIHAWHQWFYRCRDPQGSGLVAIIHPWESGRDNSADWDAAFQRVPTDGTAPFQRRDTTHANPDHRPTDEQYKRYIWLVQRFRRLGWDNQRLHDASPFQMVDPGFNAILLRACLDTAALADELGFDGIAAESRGFAKRGLAAIESLWSESLGQYICYDRALGAPVASASVGGLLAVFCPVPQARAAVLARRIEHIGATVRYLVPSHDPQAAEFDGRRYWRGPVWLVVNYMIADGLKAAGEYDTARNILLGSIRLTRESGFAEYYDPIDATPCGGGNFTWAAAMLIEILNSEGLYHETI